MHGKLLIIVPDRIDKFNIKKSFLSQYYKKTKCLIYQIESNRTKENTYNKTFELTSLGGTKKLMFINVFD